MTTVIVDGVPTQCLACKHLKRAGYLDGGCTAFEKIPDDMIWGGDHREPLEGDHGVQFDLSARDGAAEAFSDWRSAFAS